MPELVYALIQEPGGACCAESLPQGVFTGKDTWKAVA